MNEQPILIAVSGGPDSMALLYKTFLENPNIIVCHCNYKKRQQSDIEQTYVESFCHNLNIQCFTKVIDYYKSGNFQNFARVERYKFFSEVYVANNCQKLLVAHHLDDFIENYFLQKQKGTIVTQLGLSFRTELFDMIVERPLLNISKEELIKYLDDQNIKYYIDESNLSNAYARNKIRHEIVEKMTYQEKLDLYIKIQIEQQKIDNIRLKYIEEYKQMQTKGHIDYLMFKDSQYQKEIIYYYLKNENDLKSEFSKARLNDIIEKLTKDTCNIEIEDKVLVKANNVFSLIDNIAYTFFYYIINQNDFMSNENFILAKKGMPRQEIYVNEDSYPLVIRSYLPQDIIRLKKGTKKLSRFLLEMHIPKLIRKKIPIVFDKFGNVILIPLLYQDNFRNKLKSGKFVIQLNIDI
jgi:tRNA(Ile)-lysidine synthase